MTDIVAHRGGTGRAAPNTLEAFAEARALGADGVELDVRRSADGALVVHHDEAVDGLGPVCDLEVGVLPASVPLLGEALEVCAPMVVHIEIKNPPGEVSFDPDELTAVAVASLLAERAGRDRVVVSSFGRPSLDALRAAGGATPVGWLLGLSADAPACLEEAIGAGYDALHPFVTQVGPELVERAHGAGLGVTVWTVNAAADIERLLALGVDAIITDTPAQALALDGRPPRA